jgi:hypothetical protein
VEKAREAARVAGYELEAKVAAAGVAKDELESWSARRAAAVAQAVAEVKANEELEGRQAQLLEQQQRQLASPEQRATSESWSSWKGAVW